MRKGSIIAAAVTLLAGAAPATAQNFEAKLAKAEKVERLVRVLGPFLQKCGAGDGLRDIQCRAIRRRMQHRAKNNTYWTTVSAVRVGQYNNTRLNFPIAVQGCLTCAGPIKLDKTLYGNARWYMTVGTPRRVLTKAGKPQFVGLDLYKTTQAVGPSQVDNWMQSTLPNLKVQLIYTVDGQRWPLALGKGLSAKLVGYRLYNQCNGEVIASSPRSLRKAPVVRSASCGAKREVVRAPPRRRKAIPDRLSPFAVKSAMARISTDIQRCYDQFQVPGLARAAITVRNDGRVIKVRVKGKFAGSPTTGACLVTAIKKARFNPFRIKKMTFTYRWDLR